MEVHSPSTVTLVSVSLAQFFTILAPSSKGVRLPISLMSDSSPFTKPHLRNWRWAMDVGGASSEGSWTKQLMKTASLYSARPRIWRRILEGTTQQNIKKVSVSKKGRMNCWMLIILDRSLLENRFKLIGSIISLSSSTMK